MIVKRVKLGMNRGSHLPVLMKLVLMTTGPILELGCGPYSSPFLHWACFPTKRRLVTVESKPDFYDFAKESQSDFHEIRCISDWDSLDLSEPWSIAFVDHDPDDRRIKEIARLTHADFVVAHDSENARERKYRYSTIFHLFKYRWKYDVTRPHTSVFSNKYDLIHFKV